MNHDLSILLLVALAARPSSVQDLAWMSGCWESVVGQSAASFPLVRLSGQEAVFENPQHDFPQRVIYRRDGDRLTGRIEGRIGGEAKEIDFPMERRPCM